MLVLLSAGLAPAMERPSAVRPQTPPPAAEPPPVFVIPPDERPFLNAPDGAGIVAEGLEEPVQPHASVLFTFPTEMVSSDKIDAMDATSPVVVWPPLATEFWWITPTRGTLAVQGPVIPGQVYRFRLREDLRDAAGNPLDIHAWGAEMRSPEFRIVEESYGERTSLNARPQVPLEFNFPIRLADAAFGLWFQNRATLQRFPVEVLLNSPETEPDGETSDVTLPFDEKVYSIRVRPRDPLPVGAFYDLVVDGVTDALASRGLPFPRVFALGPTKPLEIEYVGAQNRPLAPPSIEIKFRQALDEDPLPEGAVRIVPEVANVRALKSGAFITVEGDFQIGQRYAVTISDQVRGANGYPMAKSETWGATFRPRPATGLFPDRLLRQRSALGLRLAFFQVNTGELEWKLAPIPLNRLSSVTARLREFEEEVIDPQGRRAWNDEGFFAPSPTDLLVPTLGLEPVASGKIPASDGDRETLREISWKPEVGELSGPMLLEVSGRDARGRIVGNRAIVFFGEHAITRKLDRTTTTVRVAGMGDAKPVLGARVRALDGKFRLLAEGTTDSGGLAVFPRSETPGVEYFTAEIDGKTSLQPLGFSDPFPSGYPEAIPPTPLRGFVFTDRTLYRPGQPVSFKGLLREEKSGRLEIPVGRPVEWTLGSAYGNQVFATGRTKIDAEGSWNASWTPPLDGPLGPMKISAKWDTVDLPGTAEFRIEEFRNPPFSVRCAVGQPVRPRQSTITVSSQFFHGAPNIGARVVWTATWMSDSDGDYYDGVDSFKRVDLYSEHRVAPIFTAEVSGEAALDENGRVVLTCEAPFRDPGNRAHSRVSWKVDVTGPDGQTITGGTGDLVAMEAVLLGVRTKDPENTDTLVFEWDAGTPFGETPKAVRAELFEVVTKTAKERVAPNVYRYRNFDRFVSVQTLPDVTNHELSFRPKNPGRYVLVVSPLDGAPGISVSEEAYLGGEETSEVPVVSDTAATVLSVQGGTTPQGRPWQVGETAALTVLTPTPGVAWVTVETDTILDTFTMPLAGNTSRIEIPIRPEYEPNVFVSVYVLTPGGPEALAGERFGYTSLAVTAPDRRLAVNVTTASPRYQPGEKIRGNVHVTTATGAPVPGADLAVYAVDDSILTLGGWSRPSFLQDFFPSRPFGVSTFSALHGYVDRFRPSELTMKGFVIGDGGGDLFSDVGFARKEFQPIILWAPNVKTGADGVAAFACEAPDNLTRFRVVAVAQTRTSQFGSGDTTFEVSKDLLIDPALPRFLREGDEVELRAVVRQKVADSDEIAIRCRVDGALTLIGETGQKAKTVKDAPAVFRFRAKAGTVGAASVRFDAVSTSHPKLTDAIEVTLPIIEPVILRRESVSGTISKPHFRPADVAPGEWAGATGTFSLSFSTTPWLAKLMGIPYLLDYPHGCFEQKTARLLACTYLADLLAFVPNAAARRENYATVIESTLNEIAASLLADGRVPYWPRGTTANDYVTIQTAWCAGQAAEAGFNVPERLVNELPAALEAMLARRSPAKSAESLRAFALFVLSTLDDEVGEDVQAAASDLFLQRDRLSGEGRAMLAIAMNRFGLSPEKQARLISELPVDFSDVVFHPLTFSSATRTETLCTWARLLVTPAADTARLKQRLNQLLESSASLSTQENLWLLVAFDALLKAEPATTIRAKSLQPAPQIVSENRTAAAWTDQDLERLSSFVLRDLPKSPSGGSYVLSAAYRSTERLSELEAQGLRIERVIKNLTDPTRRGTPEAPFQLGDQLVISYRFEASQPQSFVAVEDLLPAGLEVVNPNLALFGKFYSPPDEPGVSQAVLSHSEMRDRQTNLYFDDLPAGSSSYAVLARATAVGSFIWPATQIQPMYDSRFFGRSPSSVCVVAE